MDCFGQFCMRGIVQNVTVYTRVNSNIIHSTVVLFCKKMLAKRKSL